MGDKEIKPAKKEKESLEDRLFSSKDRKHIYDDDFKYGAGHLGVYAIMLVLLFGSLSILLQPLQKQTIEAPRMSDAEQLMVKGSIGAAFEVIGPVPAQRITESWPFALLIFTSAGLVVGTAAYLYHKKLYQNHKQLNNKRHGKQGHHRKGHR